MSNRPEYILTAEDDAKTLQVVTPSNISCWAGARSQETDFTPRQIAALERQGFDPATVDRLQVRVGVSAREFWFPATTYSRVVRLIICPVVGRRLDRVRVIAPNGEAKLVYPDGSLKRAALPRRRAA
jgi:hypothetical protein